MRKKTLLLQNGFTLIEVLIVIIILGVLGAIAYPSYTTYIARGKRNECRAGVMQVMQQQERYFTQYNTYLAVANNAENPRIKNFSGDSSDSSACIIASTTCDEDDATVATCIEIQATARFGDKPPTSVEVFYMDSKGARACKKKGGERYTLGKDTASSDNCWKG
ncbi:MAG: type IV pilin protein [Brachymonas sp.]|nr:type IV pilin protein [Brachymonas sp.]